MRNWLLLIWRCVIRMIAVAIAAAMLSWPALWNGLALLYPDSLEYLSLSRAIVWRLRGYQFPLILNRSAIFYWWMSLWNDHALWRIVAVQAVLMAWVLWLVVRAFARQRPVPSYLVSVALLAIFTSVGWFVSYVMADVYGPMLYLAVFLLVFAADTLRWWERVGLYLIGLLGVVSHSTHFLVACGLCGLLAVLWLMRWKPMRRRGYGIAVVASLIVVAAFAQTRMNRAIFGTASLFGQPPAFLMARMIEDGPVREYLEERCPIHGWIICNDVHGLPANTDDFLFAPGSIWQTASPSERAELRREQTQLALAVLRTYPLRQTARSMRNAMRLLFSVGPDGFWDYSSFTPHALEDAEPGLNGRYRRTRQSHSAMPGRIFQHMQQAAILIAVATVIVLLPWAWKTGQMRLLGLAAIVLFVLPVNAFLNGALSGVFWRNQDRVAWLMELLAGLMLGMALSARPNMMKKKWETVDC